MIQRRNITVIIEKIGRLFLGRVEDCLYNVDIHLQFVI